MVGLAHIAMTFVQYESPTLDALWFIGSGFFVLLAGGINVVAAGVTARATRFAFGVWDGRAGCQRRRRTTRGRVRLHDERATAPGRCASCAIPLLRRRLGDPPSARYRTGRLVNPARRAGYYAAPECEASRESRQRERPGTHRAAWARFSAMVCVIGPSTPRGTPRGIAGAVAGLRSSYRRMAIIIPTTGATQ